MQGFVRAKRVTDPLNDKVKAQLVGDQLSFVSSGSDHSGADDFPCLSELVHDFLEHEIQDQPPGYDSEHDRVDSAIDSIDKIEHILRSTANSNVDLYKNLLLTHVLKALELFSCLRQQKTVLRRKVMSFLRELGHNAAICKTKWNSSGGLNAGNYEFIDVVKSSSCSTGNRYFIDLDFASEFQIARPTNEYKRLMELLPRVYVGNSEELKMIVKATSDAAKKSLKTRDLTLPPWRKNRYMQNKWFAPYKRTINPMTAVSLAPVLPSINKGVHRRCVGFNDGLNSRLYVRTRG
ncbi:hypothetical protein ACOSP7_003316 [Xanthoceras sorbifolium]|uniref:Uncharacterized protein n=1 Tax=Xanthoceras sorbifolium TaxID=99658 RepID=A0ABQ8II74_9ROSI|nr:hypothetical protein JRO89_XS01G0056400 [Xanthoceras sorbifolium]